MNRPDNSLLEKVAPIELWEIAIKQAKRSTMRRFRTGAVAYHISDFEVYARACSHTHNGGMQIASVHAEHALVNRLRKNNPGGAVALVVTLNNRGSFTSSSRPCLSCAKLLSEQVWGVVYADKSNDGSWIINHESPNDMIGRAYKAHGKFARTQRIPALSGV